MSYRLCSPGRGNNVHKKSEEEKTKVAGAGSLGGIEFDQAAEQMSMAQAPKGSRGESSH